jgi:chondroitin 4-sulfotransferase 11
VEHNQEVRQTIYSKTCARYGRRILQKSTRRKPQSMYVIDSHKLLYCRLPKIGCTNWKRVIAYLSGNLTAEAVLSANHSTVHSDYHRAYVKELAYANYTQRTVDYLLAAYFKFVFIRHPLERLLSAYADKINTTSEEKFENIDYAGYIKQLCRGNSSNNSTNFANPVTFQEFLCYVSKAPPSKLNRHWQPYWMICTFCQSSWRYDFIGEYDSMEEEANVLLNRWGVRTLRFPTKNFTRQNQVDRFKNAYDSVPKSVIHAVYRRYRLDFDLFGYKKYPSFYSTGGI